MIIDIGNFEELLRGGEKIGIVGHFNPDGDAVGSVTALHHFLRGIGKDSDMILPSDYPPFLKFLDSDKSILTYTKKKETILQAIPAYDLIICLDFNTLSRTEGLKDVIAASPATKILIDHHPNPEREFFNLVFSEVAVSSTSELLFWILMNTSVVSHDADNLPRPCAISLATGMITDTNNFNNSAKASTFEMASLLIKRGINLEVINRTVFGNFSENRMRLMGQMLLNRMVIIPEHHAAYMILSLDDQESFGYEKGDSEGFVNLPLQISGINLSTTFVETKDYIRVSIRSKGDVPANALSNTYFNGGGHFNAAGGRLYISLKEVNEYYRKALDNFFENKA